MTQAIRIPDIGDFDSVEVVEVLVAAGDEVSEDDPLIVIESDKASMEVPAGCSGVIDEIRVKVGDEVSEGDVIATVHGTAAAEAPEPDASGEAEAADESDAPEQEPRTTRDEEQAPGSDSDADGTGQASTRTVEVRVPDIGDATDVVVIEVAVKPGDPVGPDDLLVVVESDKASMEIPAGHAGRISALHVEEGSEVEEGTLLATLEVAGEVPVRARSADVGPAAEPTAGPQRETEPTDRPPAREAARAGVEEPSQPAREEPRQDEAGSRVYAGPAVRRLARELGVALTAVSGTGTRGRILKDDVKAYVKETLAGGATSGGAGIPPVPAVDFSKFGPVEMVPMSRIRVAGAANLHRSWLNVPHVTQHEEADVTELEAFRASLKAEAERRGTKVTPLPFIIKACCHALKAFPTFNASLDPEAKQFILKGYFHIGFAVDSDDGLVVPVIRDADKLGIWELSEAILALSQKVREKKLGMNDLQGGTFSVSSLGNIGGTGFTPIINMPEVAILGVSRLATKPIWDGSEFRPRKMLPLSLSYDHRAINGAEAGRFMEFLAGLLSDIRRLAL